MACPAHSAGGEARQAATPWGRDSDSRPLVLCFPLPSSDRLFRVRS